MACRVDSCAHIFKPKWILKSINILHPPFCRGQNADRSCLRRTQHQWRLAGRGRIFQPARRPVLLLHGSPDGRSVWRLQTPLPHAAAAVAGVLRGGEVRQRGRSHTGVPPRLREYAEANAWPTTTRRSSSMSRKTRLSFTLWTSPNLL